MAQQYPGDHPTPLDLHGTAIQHYQKLRKEQDYNYCLNLSIGGS